MRHFDLEQGAEHIVKRQSPFPVGVEAGNERTGDDEAKPETARFVRKRPKGDEPLELRSPGAPAFLERTGELRQRGACRGILGFKSREPGRWRVARQS